MSRLQTLKIHYSGTVEVLQIARPHRRNAINGECLEELDTCIAEAARNDAVRTLVLTGDDVAFSSGQDLKEIEPPDYVSKFNYVVSALEALPKPTVAAVAGWCVAGGLELALACDLRIGADELNIGDFHARINSIGGGGVAARLPRVVGLSQAKFLMFTARTINAAAALRIGLVDEVHPLTGYLEAAVDLASGLVPNSPLTASYAKRALHEGLNLPRDVAVQRSLTLHRELQEALAAEPVD